EEVGAEGVGVKEEGGGGGAGGGGREGDMGGKKGGLFSRGERSGGGDPRRSLDHAGTSSGEEPPGATLISNKLEDTFMWRALTALAALALASANAMAEETVKVGLILPMTGPFTTTGKQVEAGPRFFLHPTR